MTVQVGLVVFAVNVNNPINAYVLLQTVWKDDELAIPSMQLLSNVNSIDTVLQIIGKATYITGNWIEFNFIEQAGFYDDVDRNPNEREIFLVYSLMLPDMTSLKPGFKWVALDNLSANSLYLDHYNIIRYCRTIQKR